jgi:Phosphoesterase family
VPPAVDKLGYGLRVPGIMISPYAKRGYVDHQIPSFDAYNKFIEDDFLNEQRLNPRADGRPDPVPTCGTRFLCWATWYATLTSLSDRGHRCCFRSAR